MSDSTILIPTKNRPANAGASMSDDASRKDGVQKVTGAAKYGKDVFPANGLFISFVRCPWGVGELTGFDKDAAMKVPGVIEVDIDKDKKEGKYNGATVGYVVAESPLALKRGLAALACNWKRRDAVTRLADALGEVPSVDEAAAGVLKGAEMTLEAVYSTEVQTHSSLETHGVSIDHKGDTAIVYASTQGTFSVRDGLDDAIKLKRSEYEVVCEFVGGGFGSKLNGAGKEGTTAARIAAKYKRPAYLFCNRAEEHLDTGNRPGSRARISIGFKKDGTILGGEVRTWGSVGPNKNGGGCNVPSGRYDLGNTKKAHEDVALNAGMPRAFRAPGHPQGAFVEELMLDEIALACDLDPLAMRMKIIKSDAIKEMAALGAKQIGWDQRSKTGSQTGVVRRGMGMGITSWGRFPANVEAEVVINQDGSVEARTGTQDIGTGQRTMVAIITSDGLGISVDAVAVRIGNSTLPEGPGSGGSVTTVNSAPAFMAAAADAKRKMLEAVAQRMNADPGELDIKSGVIQRGGQNAIQWKDACAMLGNAITGKGENNRASVQADKTSGTSNGAQFVDLQVDTQTGIIQVNRIVAVQACGRVVARKLAESQIIGGVIQGLSYALFENRLLDRATGAMVNPNMEWYKIAGPRDMPLIQPILWTKDGTGPRPLGEPPTIPTSGAIACALLNALGVPVRSLPLTPNKVLAALEKGGRA